jgi:flagellar protein FliS
MDSMQTPNRIGYQAYNRNKYETASPHKLILMLYEGALQYGSRARTAIQNENIAEANRAIQKVQDIIGELLSTLNLKQGGEIAKNLQSLYLYMMDLLVKANTKKDVSPLDEMMKLLGEIKSAWEQIGKEVSLGKTYS